MDRKLKAILAILAMAFITLAASATSPALATIAQSFPDAPATAIASIATLSSLTAVPCTILSGMIAGRKVRFRTLTAVGLVVTFLGGLLPVFAKSIAQILLGRAVLGVGTGLIAPLTSTLVLYLFSGDDVPKQLGRNAMSTNVGAVIFQLLGGYLCNYSWRMPFLAYLAVLPVLLIVLLCLPEPEKGPEKARQKLELREVLTGHVVGWGAFFAAHMIFFYPIITEMSGIVLNNGFGDAAMTAVILSVLTGTGVLGGYLFYPVHRRCGLVTLSAGFGLCGVGYVLMIFASGAWGLLLAAAVFGVGYGLLQPTFTYYLGVPLKPELRAASLSVYHIFTSLGTFGSAFVLSFLKQLTGTGYERFSFAVGLGFYGIAAVCVLFFSSVKRRKEPKEEKLEKM